MKISCIDHFVLTVACLEATCDFYSAALGMKVVTFGEGRHALEFGTQKINLHQAGSDILPRAEQPMSGSADFCLISDTPLDDVVAHLAALEITVEEGPVERTGARGPIQSIYLRDPDRNLIEISEYQ